MATGGRYNKDWNNRQADIQITVQPGKVGLLREYPTSCNECVHGRYCDGCRKIGGPCAVGLAEGRK